MRTIARAILPVFVMSFGFLLALATPALADSIPFPDLVLVEINLTWTTIPWLPGPVTVSGSNLWSNSVGYVDANTIDNPNGVANYERYVVTGTGFPSNGYFDIGWFGQPSSPFVINLEAMIPGPSGVTGGFQHFTVGGFPTPLLPGDYAAIDHARFFNESGPLSTYGLFVADSGSIRVVAVPEPASLLLVAVGLVGLVAAFSIW